jgi:hypothetical protein
MDYNDAVLTITNISTPDPHVTFVDDTYYMVSRTSVEFWDNENADWGRSTQLETESKYGRPQASWNSEMFARKL